MQPCSGPFSCYIIILFYYNMEFSLCMDIDRCWTKYVDLNWIQSAYNSTQIDTSCHCFYNIHSNCSQIFIHINIQGTMFILLVCMLCNFLSELFKCYTINYTMAIIIKNNRIYRCLNQQPKKTPSTQRDDKTRTDYIKHMTGEKKNTVTFSKLHL